MHETAHITVVHRSPFVLGDPDVWTLPLSTTIAQIVARVPLQERALFMRRGVVMIDGHEVYRGCWHVTRPRNGTAVTLHMPLRGGEGGGGSSKQVMAIVAALAITIASAGAAAGLFGTALGIAAIGPTTLGATLLAGAISFGGSMLVASLSSTPVKQQDSSDTQRGNDAASLDPASIQGNVLQPNTPLPRVIGTRRIHPPFVTEPTAEYVGQDEIVHAVYSLAGPHAVSLPRFGSASYDPAELDSDIALELYDGLPDSELPDYPERYSRTFGPGVQLSTHGHDPIDLSKFQEPLPVWHGSNTADDADEVWLHFLLSGLIQQASPSDPLRVPIRIRMRLRGTPTWRYLPELHYQDVTQSQRRFQIKLRFNETFPGPFSQPPNNRGFVEARKAVPAQNVSPLGAVWNCDSYFSAGAGDDDYTAGTYSTTKIRNINIEPDCVTVYLSDAAWPAGIYDIEVKRGATIRNALYTPSTYVYNGNVLDLFGMRASLALPLTHEGLFDRIDYVRTVSIRNMAPIAQAGSNAMMYVTATNRQVGNFSVEASGYVHDVDGGGNWTQYVTTSNPAPHFRDILTGTLNFNPLPMSMLDDASLLEWRNVCASEGYRCDMVVEGGSIFETLRLVASCGYARTYSSEVWGVIRDYDRSAEAPVQIFSPRNTRGFSWQKAFPRLPDGLRVNFRDEDAEYSGRQIVVYRNGINQLNAQTEQITYDGLVSRDAVIERAAFDLLQGELRSAVYSFEAPVESIVCRRGSLVGLNHDILLRQTGSARVLDVTRNGGGNVVSLTLDTDVELFNSVDMVGLSDVLSVTDVMGVGLQSSVAVRHSDGTNSVHPLTGASGYSGVVTFATPYDDDNTIEDGNLLVVGITGNEYKRLIVTEIAPGRDLTATLTLVDEAPKLWG